MLLTDDLLLHYKRCKRRAFLDIYGDLSRQDQEQEFLKKLRRDSQTHQQAFLAKEVHHSPNYPRGDWQAGAKATLELMQQGKERISQGVLLMQSQGVTLLSRPDLLVKQPGQSIFGDWIYVPTSIKLGRRPKPEYQIVAAFSAQLLAATQGISPSSAWLILRRQDSYAVNLERWLPLMQDILSECLETLLLPQEPEVFISRQRCSLCRWYSSCYAIAKANQHLSLLPGVTPARYRDLQTLGVTTVKSLATASISTLETVVISEVASSLIQQAQSTVQNQAILRQDFSHVFSKKTNILSTASVELYFDIEAEPELQLDYLLGVLVINRRTNTETFYAFLAESPQDEASIWQQFLDLVALYPDAPIFHYSDYEVETVKRLFKLYKTSTPQQVKQLLSRFVDVHQQVMDTVKLPVESYSLKHLARWLGFEWRDAGVTGQECVCLYDQWLETSDRSLLSLILRYNEDDCRATHHLKNWLVNFLQNPVQS
ncbi:MAG: TM0106 family RecB-like putative nuclease [Coleofasciculaceae cyanobacterium]